MLVLQVPEASVMPELGLQLTFGGRAWRFTNCPAMGLLSASLAMTVMSDAATPSAVTGSGAAVRVDVLLLGSPATKWAVAEISKPATWATMSLSCAKVLE